MTLSLRVDLTEASHVAEARRVALRLAPRPAFSETRRGEVAIVVTELATNLLKHAGGGEIVARARDLGGMPEVEVLALDRGPGIADLRESLRDGFSTAGSPGTGLGAVSRLSTVFDVHTVAGRGTAVLSRIAADPRRRSPRDSVFELGAVCLPVRSESSSGDDWSTRWDGDALHVAVVDGLGHGPFAADAARAAVATFRAGTGEPAAVLHRIHEALRGTRGAAVAIAAIDRRRAVVTYAGIGNITARIVSDGASHDLVSLNGTLGAEIRTINEFGYPWPAGMLVIHTDGLSARWDLAEYPGLRARDPALVAGVLYRDHARSRDDAAVVVAVERPQAA